MKKKLTAILLVGFICLLAFVLTKMTYEPIDSLIRPPKIEGENSEIQAAFESSVDSGYVFKSPLAGEYRSSFIRKNIDIDSSDEVIVFYSKTDALDVIRINILDKINGLWESIADIESPYNDIHQINFADVDADGVTEIIVCWRNFENELLNTLNVYEIVERNEIRKIQTVFSRNYSEFLLCDVNSDNKTDVLIFEKTTENGTNELKGTYFDFLHEEALPSEAFFLDPAISSIVSVCYDYEDENILVYIDGYKTYTGITTDVIYWDSYENTFRRIETSESASIATVATRSRNIYSSDINGDSIIEIPVEDYIPDSEVYDDTQDIRQQNVIVWMQYDGYDLTEVQYEIFNTKYDYSLKIPAESFYEITVTNDLTNGILTFYKVNTEEPPQDGKKSKKQGESRGEQPNREPVRENLKEELFSIFVTSDLDYDIYELNGYRLITTDNGFNYYYQISQYGKNYGITKETIKSILST